MNTTTANPAARFLEALPAPADGLLASMRQAARARFVESGFPTRRHEDWRFTDLKPLIEARFDPPKADPNGLETLLATVPEEMDRLVFIDGRFDTARSRVNAVPPGAVIGSFSAWARANPAEAEAAFDHESGGDKAFLSLNGAFFSDGAVVILPDAAELERPLHLVFWNGGAAVQLKSLIRLGYRARATIVETYAGIGAGWTNAATTIDLAEASELGRHVLQQEAPDAFHTANVNVTLGSSARHDGFLLTLGARMARQDAVLTLAGDHAWCGYSGAYLLSGLQEATVRSLIRHEAPNGACREVFKGCIDERAHGVFQGRIHVAQAAQKTDGYQLCKTILLSDRAQMDAKPELEIYADDVKCSHGATVGDLDETALFYLRARGIGPDEARDILVQAFVMDAVEQIGDSHARDRIAAAVKHRLETRP